MIRFFSFFSFQVDSPLYLTLLSLFVYSLENWNQSKITFLKRLLVTAHARHTNPSGTSKYEPLIDSIFVSCLCLLRCVMVFWHKETLRHAFDFHFSNDMG